MDPNSGRLYPSLEDARRAGVARPVEIIGSEEDIRRVSAAVARDAANSAGAASRERRRAAASCGEGRPQGPPAQPVSHTQIGQLAGDADTGGIVGIGGSVLFDEYQTVAVSTISEGKELPVIALEMSGRLNKSADTIGVVYLLSVLDAGMIAGALLDAAHRIGGTADTDFKVGVSQGVSGDRS